MISTFDLWMMQATHVLVGNQFGSNAGFLPGSSLKQWKTKAHSGISWMQQCFQFDDSASVVSSRKAVCSQEESGASSTLSYTSSCDLSPWDCWCLDTTSQQVLPSEKLVRVKTNRLCSELQTAASIKSFLPLSSWRVWTTLDIDLLGAQDLDSESRTAKPWWPQEAERTITRSECHQKERSVEMKVICCWDIHGSEHFLAAGASNEAN